MPERVLLLNPPGRERYLRDYYCSTISKAGYYWHPGDLLMQSGHFAEAGHEVQVLDCIAENLSPDQARARIDAFAPTTILSLISAASWPEDLPFLEQIQRSTGAVLLASGEPFLDRAQEILESNPFISACLFDFTSADPVRFIAGARDVTTMAFRDGEQIRIQREHPRGEFSLPIPRHELFPLSRYRMPGAPARHWASLLTNFGCPFPCDFCNSCTFGFSWRSPENVRAECERLVEMGIRHVFIKDMTFAAKRAHGLAIIELLRDLPLTWHCWCRVDLIDAELAQAMARSGCVLVQFGVESGSPEVLASHGKRYTPDQTREAFELLSSHGIACGAHYILGLPGETEESLEQTIELACQLPALYASFNLFTPRHGTPLREQAIQRGLIDPLTVIDSSSFSPIETQAGLSAQTLEHYKRRAYRRFYLRSGYLASQLARPRGWLNHTRLGLGLARALLF